MYSKFAPYYDKLGWDRYSYGLFYKLLPFLERKKIENRKFLDLACGTGTLALEATNHGFKVDGIDLSKEMIEVAKTKDILNRTNFFVADIRSFQMNRKYALITCFYALDHLLTKEDLLAAFKKVREHLKDKGSFIFDMKTAAGISQENPLYIKKTSDYTIVRQNFYHQQSGLVTKKVLAFVRDGHKKYAIIKGTLKERGYSQKEIEEMLKRVGFKRVETIDLVGKDPQNHNEKRIFWRANQEMAR